MKILNYEISQEGLLPEEFNKKVTGILIEGILKGELQFVLNQELTDENNKPVITVKSVTVEIKK